MVRKRLGELLVEAGFISQEQLNYALEEQKISKQKLGQVLLRLDYIAVNTLIVFLNIYGTIGITPFDDSIDEEAVKLIPEDVARKYKVIPIKLESEGIIKKLIVGMLDPSNLETIGIITFITGCVVEPVFIAERGLWLFIEYYYH